MEFWKNEPNLLIIMNQKENTSQIQKFRRKKENRKAENIIRTSLF